MGSVRAEGVVTFSSLQPAPSGAPELVASRRGTVRAGRRPERAGASFRGAGLYPEQAARVVSVGYQGERKKLLIELAPLRWDRSKGGVLLARRLVVQLVLEGRDQPGHRESERHRGTAPVVRLLTQERELYAVSFEEAMGRRARALPADSLRLSRQGEPVAFHLQPDPEVFGPGSLLYFVSEGASLNPYGQHAVYELERASGGLKMRRGSARTSGPAV